MKLTVKLLSVCALLGLLMTYSGCGKDKTPAAPPADAQIDALSKHVWKATVVTLDNDPQTDYTGSTPFTLTFSGTKGSNTVNFTAGGRPAFSAWPASGKFTFSTTAPTTSMTRNDSATDNVPFAYTVSDTQLTLKFSYTGAGFTSRVDNVKGEWIFTLVPQ